MSFVLVTTANARRDIQEAIDWENRRQLGLGKRFLIDLDEKLSALVTTPYLGSVRYLDVRCLPTYIFQYLIHYTVDEVNQRIVILRVLHTSRKPAW